MPQVSVVIPCHNCERTIEATLASALAQSLTDLEVVCVDNSSSDGTPRLLEEAAKKDGRVRVISEPTLGEGPARETGRRAATGEWLYFLDSDDLMGHELLSHTVSRGEDTGADLVVFRTSYLDDVTGEVRPCDECFRTDWIHDWAREGVFEPAANPERLFNSFQNWVHNKLFRASFVEAHGLEFQPVHRMADILFTCRALAEAGTIALLDESLHLYRCNNLGSALHTTDSYPLDFFVAFRELKRSLQNKGLFDLYRNSYIDWAEEAVAMNLYRANSFAGFKAIARRMKDGGLDELCIGERPQELVDNDIRHECCMAIRDLSLEEIGFHYFYLERRHMRDLETQLSWARKEIQGLKGLRSYKLHEKLVSLRSRLHRPSV